MLLIKSVLGNIVFRRILVIFVIGLVSRILINYVYDVDVFKDFISSTSLIYYVFITCFVSFVKDFNIISFNVFNFKIIRSGVVMVCKNYISNMWDGDKMFVGMEENSDKDCKDKYINNLFYNQNTDYSGQDSERKYSRSGRNKNSSHGSKSSNGRSVSGPFSKSAGLKGLYSNESSSGSSSVSYNGTSRSVKSAGLKGLYSSESSSGIEERSSRRLESRSSGSSVNSSNVVQFSRNSNGELVITKMPGDKNVTRNNPVSWKNKISSPVSNDSRSIVIGLEPDSDNVQPRAPRPSNLSTPETMSPLFPSSETRTSSSGSGYNADRSNSRTSTGSGSRISNSGYRRDYSTINNLGWDYLYKNSFYSNHPRDSILTSTSNKSFYRDVTSGKEKALKALNIMEESSKSKNNSPVKERSNKKKSIFGKRR